MPLLIRRHNTDLSSSSTGSGSSQESQSTAPSSLSGPRTPTIQRAFADGPVYKRQIYESPCYHISPQSSTETYASTIPDGEELCEEPEPYESEYGVPEYRSFGETNVRPSSPSDFAKFFPSMKRLSIRHDDTTYDGNMNLRVEADDGSARRKTNIQLFHMRMRDLKDRSFSLRRYERSSGREVCHSSRQYVKPASERRPALARSVTHALSTIVGKPDFKRTSSGLSTHSSKSLKSWKRQDSGYGSNDEEFDDFFNESDKKSKEANIQIPTNTIKVEFSNYAHVDVTRRGARSSKRYEFEYWGSTYNWKRVTETVGVTEMVSYHLYRGDNSTLIAHIVPELRLPEQIRAEAEAGGWVPPCSLWISDKSVLDALTDVADVIVATGLIALVDDCIERNFHPKHKTRHVNVPLTSLKMDMEFVGPKAIMEHMFRRRNSDGSTKDQRSSPLRYASSVEGF